MSAKARCACGVWIIGDRARWAVPTCVGCLPPPPRLPIRARAGLLVLLLALVGCAGTFDGSRAWEPRVRTGAAGVAVALLAVDVGQTRWMADNYNSHVMRCPCVPGATHGYSYTEMNPLLGEHPSKLAATAYLGTVAAGVVATRAWAPRWASWAVSGLVVAVESTIVIHNANNGEGMSW
jgi:hypothetical protein